MGYQKRWHSPKEIYNDMPFISKREATLITIITVFLIAGVVKGVIGLGLPTIAMGLLTLTMSLATAAGLLIIPSLATNIWQLLFGPAFLILIKRLWTFLSGSRLEHYSVGYRHSPQHPHGPA